MFDVLSFLNKISSEHRPREDMQPLAPIDYTLSYKVPAHFCWLKQCLEGSCVECCRLATSICWISGHSLFSSFFPSTKFSRYYKPPYSTELSNCDVYFFKNQIPLGRNNISRRRENSRKCDKVLASTKQILSGMRPSIERMLDKLYGYRR